MDELLRRYEKSFPGLVDSVGHSIAALPVHAGRRAEEMAELVATLRGQGLRPTMAPAVRRVLESIAALGLGAASETGEREGDLRSTLELFHEHQLLADRGRSSRISGQTKTQVEAEKGG
jgi:hypothetical protein